MKPITLYTANCRGAKTNAFYPVKRIIKTLDELSDALQYDQVFAEYKGNHRGIADFIRSDCLPFDCDNDHSEIESEWKTAEDVEKAFPDVPFYLVYSRNHMKQKGKYGPRPRFHVIFPIDPITDKDDYLKAKTGVKYSTRQGYKTVEKLLEAEEFGSRKISEIKTSDAKLFLIMLQQEKGKSYSSIHSIRGVLRPAFQMAVDDDVLLKNPFGFELATVIVNDSVTREAITREQMRKFLNFIQDDAIYAKYYDAVYILFHTGLRISEFCGVTVKDIDLERKTLNVERQLIRTSEMDYRCETTKTAAGKRVVPLTDDVAEKFRNILAERRPPRRELVVDGHYGFLYYDKNGLPCVAMHWQHRFNRMVNQYNDLYRVPLPNVTPHVCRHTYCSNMAKSGMSPKTLQYLMGHSDISVTMNTYTHVRFDDAEEELRRLEDFRKAQSEVERQNTPPLIKAV